MVFRPAPSFKRATVWLLWLAMLWAALHPAIINATPTDSYRVLVCTPQGMEWVEVGEPSIEVLLGLEAQAPAAADEDIASELMACPWCTLAHVLPVHQGLPRNVDPLVKAYQRFNPVVPYASPIAEHFGYGMAPPVRAPPSLV